MIDSIEQWPPSMLTSLIYTLHGMTENYGHLSAADHLPFVLVMGVSTSEDLLSRMIEYDAVQLLSVKQFDFIASHELYQSLAEEILIESSPILFDESILNKLLNHCQLNDYSVSRFKEQIRYLLMAYFGSIKCCQFAAYFVDYDACVDKTERLRLLNEWWLDDDEECVIRILEEAEYNGGDERELWMEYLEDSHRIYERYREALKVFQMITDHLDFKWTKTQIIAALQEKEVLFKHLSARVGATTMSAEERAQFKPRIKHFEDCHAIYKILEAETRLFDEEFAQKAAEEYKMITTQLQRKAPVVTTTNKAKKMNTKQRRNALKRQLTAQTNKGVFDAGRKNLFCLLVAFIEKHLKPMNELPLNEIFVYKNEAQFSRDMFPPTNSKMRHRFEYYRTYFDDAQEEVETEAMSCIYDVYNQMDGLYLNLHDAYVAFRARFACDDDDSCSDDAMMDVDCDDDETKKKKRKRGKKKRKSNKEMREDEEKEKKTQIQFRMSVDDLRFCGFVKAAATRKKESLMKMA
eukprot:25938_1